jgi:hypothetical protein
MERRGDSALRVGIHHAAEKGNSYHFNTLCSRFVKDAGEILEEILR